MFNLFKKEKKEISNNASASVDAGLSKNQNDKSTIDDDTVIFTMPDKFRFPHLHASNARMMGFIIVIGGLLFLIAIAGVAYYYYQKPATKSAKTDNAIEIEKASNTPQVYDPKAGEAPPQFEPSTSTPETVTQAIEEQPIATTTATSTNEAPVTVSASTTSATSSTEAVYPAGIDSDNDGLTDKEEVSIGTNALSADTDNDGYMDESELSRLYNPSGAGKLDSDKSLKLYKNSVYKYQIYYPTTWKQNELSSDSVSFQSPDNQLIQVVTSPNTDFSSIENLYRQMTKDNDISASQILSLGGWKGVRSKNGLNVYLADPGGNTIYTVSYVPGPGNSLDYVNLFQLSINSITAEKVQ
jgi:hypothetical protein